MATKAKRSAGIRSGVCRHCGCTDEHGCDQGCSWVDAAHTVCSACVDRVVGALLEVASDQLTIRLPVAVLLDALGLSIDPRHRTWVRRVAREAGKIDDAAIKIVW